MRFGLVIHLFLGLLVGLASADDTSASVLSKIWTIDASCSEAQRQTLLTTYQDAVKLVRKARQDLYRVQDKKIERKTRSYLSDVNWDRISRNLAVIFGLTPPDDPTANGYQESETYYAQVQYVIDRLDQGVVQNFLIPEFGYSKKLKDAADKAIPPSFYCGDSQWEWKDRNDDDPNDPTKKVWEVVKELEDTPSFEGAYVYQGRYVIGKKSDGSPKLCRDDVNAVTFARHDFITFCPAFWTLSGNNPVSDKNLAVAGSKLDAFGAGSKARVMVHEFSHYYGAKVTSDGTLQNLPDQQARDKYGNLLWTKNGRYVRTKEASESTTYAYKFVINLALDQSDNEHAGEYKKDKDVDVWTKGIRGVTGPSVATRTAEAYAYFALVSYLDGWDWSSDEVAKALPEV